MGQKVHPLGFRIGITIEHKSLWYSKSKNYFLFVKEDIFIRNFIYNELSELCISDIEIKRRLDFLTINISVTKANLILGTNGSRLYELKNKLSKNLLLKFSNRNITMNVIEIINPDTNAKLLADFIRQQLEKRVPFRRIMKAAILKSQKAGINGIKIQVAGRLNGAEIARTEWIREGQVPLHTIKANIDYCNYKAQTLYGILGIKIWIYIA
uniref:ribosomal protein S3 n=1 Tax=Euglena deses TaxID=66845 RepID=UPI0023AB309B|nr:ribosomal protein S3 [Euglena deses]WCH63370.1 ribosomal protein S3 [Euglena deses]